MREEYVLTPDVELENANRRIKELEEQLGMWKSYVAAKVERLTDSPNTRNDMTPFRSIYDYPQVK